MAESFGEALPDQLSPLLTISNTHLALASDVAGLLNERAALEREYANKLVALARKAKERRDKRLPDAVVGPEPVRACTLDEAKGTSTLQTFLTTFLTTTETTATKAASLAESLDAAGTDMANGCKKRGEVVKKHAAFSQRILADRDRYYGERLKAKSKYDDSCHELEAARIKKERAEAEDKHVDRAVKSFQEAQEAMEGAKNAYLIAIVTANRAKATFYRASLPALEDNLQTLWTLSNGRLVTGLVRASTRAAEHYEELGEAERNCISSSGSVNAAADQATYVELNRRSGWTEPDDWTWEPAQGFFDTSEMMNTDAARVLLQNRLLKARARLDEHEPIIEAKRREAEGLERLRAAYEKDPALGDADAVMDNLLETLRESTSLEMQVSVLDSEVEAIEDVIGSDASDARPHRFTQHAFTIPTSCNLCQSSMWGKNLICKPCGYTCHAKCEAKVPARCKAGNAPKTHHRAPSTTLGRSATTASSSLARSNTTSTTHSSTTAPPAAVADGAPSRRTMPPVGGGAAAAMAPPSARAAVAAAPEAGDVQRGSMLYAYEATTDGELSIGEGETFEVIQEDADGWLMIRKGASIGLVPTLYTQLSSSAPTPASVAQGTGQYCVALYDYEAAAPDELSLVEGERVELTLSGMLYGDGWSEGVKGGRVGLFPSTYVRAE